MTGDDALKKLNTIGYDTPREAARARGVAAAMAAFDAAALESNTKIDPATQGSRPRNRLMSIAGQLWSTLMDTKLIAGPAIAALLIVPLGGYVTWHMMETAAFRDAAPQPVLKAKAPETAEYDAPAAVPEPNMPLTRLSQAPQAGTSERSRMTHGAARQQMANTPPVQHKMADAAERLASAPPMPEPRIAQENRDRLQVTETNPVKSAVEQPVSTFSLDVDTASYAFVRRQLMEGRLPVPETVRVEEIINYFPYDWPRPETADVPFQPTVSVVPSPWNAHRKLMHIAVKGYDVTPEERRPANLVFLIDTSGSMRAADKLPLLTTAFKMLVDQLDENDTVSIVTYAGQAGVALLPTKASDKRAILAALDGLGAGGSTAGAAGLREAYAMAESAFVEGGVNRVMLATDGDFNVGQTSDDDLKRLIEQKRESGIFLSVFGFGQGNYNDQLMQVLAQNGNGTAAYIDTLAEARKALVDEATSTLFPIAKDVKVQVEFNPAVVAEYRLIGYETRALKREDFNNDRVDAGDVGSGHSVTAIYEITPKGSSAALIDDLRYTDEAAQPTSDMSDEYAFLKLRYKLPEEDKSRLIETPITRANEKASLQEENDDLRFSIAAAGFGEKLRGSDAVADYEWADVRALAAGSRGNDPHGYRAEFLRLVDVAAALEATRR